jgi:sugar transferase (PEP-CTERM/EpsH1 system associated)
MAFHVLFLTPQLPFPPRQGTALRNWGLIKTLARHASVSLLAMAEDDRAVPEELRAVCRHVWTSPRPRRSQAQRLRDLASGQADLARRLWSPRYAQALRQVLAETLFDLVQVEALEMAGYIPVVRAAAPATRVAYDAHNAEHIIQARALAIDRRQPRRWPAAGYSALQVGRLRRYEAWACQAADLVTCVSREDAAALRTLVPALQPLIIPNGIDLAAYAGREQPPDAGLLVFTGKMDYRPNVDAILWFATNIMPRIRARCPRVRCLIVGQQPPPALVQLDGHDGLVVTGEVAETIPYIARAAVYIAPLRMGGGTRFKLLEAMALGRPVVSTMVGAEGFAVRSGQEVLLADTAEAFAAAVVRLLDEPERAREMGRAGRAFVQDHYDWERLIPRLVAAYDDLLSRRKPTAGGG